MAKYLFEEINAGVEMQNPQITVSDILDKGDGTAIVWVFISLGAAGGKAATFKIQLKDPYPYTGDEPIKEEVDAWAVIEIAKYEV
jgi:hypothetical protein